MKLTAIFEHKRAVYRARHQLSAIQRDDTSYERQRESPPIRRKTTGIFDFGHSWRKESSHWFRCSDVARLELSVYRKFEARDRERLIRYCARPALSMERMSETSDGHIAYADGIELARSTMARCVEDVGASLGAVVLAMVDDARRTAFCLSTDATGISIRPEPLADGSRQPCRKGHFFVVLANKKHVFFEYQSKHTSAAVCEMFRGFSGSIQADASAVYDALFRGEAVDDPSQAPVEVGCWAHCRRRCWEAAVVGHPLGRQGLLRIRKLYQLDQSWTDLPPSARHKKRQTILKPLVDEFFAWVSVEYVPVKDQRGLVPSALGYASRQEQGLRNFLRDGRLRMDNNLSEGALKPVCTGRRAWLFFGSDDHANAAANLFSLIASCQLHGIDPEQYVAELIVVMPYGPRERYLELAPAYWLGTRSSIARDDLSREIGPITLPPPVACATEQSESN